MVLIAYRIAAEIVLAIAAAGKPLWPARWRIAERLGRDWPEPADARRPSVWLHAASLGECKGLWAFARTLRDRDAGFDADFVLTANTEAGLGFLRAAIARDGEPGRWRALPAPLDHPRLARRFLRAFDVRALILFEVELWPHWMFAAREADVPVLWISARWNARARRRYGMFPGAARRVLRALDWIQAQDEEDAAPLRALGATVETGADLRGLHYLDSPGPDAAGGPRRGIAFVSFHAGELTSLVTLLEAAREESPLIVFPRKPGELPAFRTALAPFGFVLHSVDPGAKRVIVDGFGKVGETLGSADLAIVGGSFVPRGGHNLWEPLLAGARIAIGPHHENQAWLARRLRDAGALDILDAPEDFGAIPERSGANPPRDALIDSLRDTLRRAAERARDRVFRAVFPTRNAGLPP